MIRSQLLDAIDRQLEVHVPIAGLINVEAEVTRLEKQVKKLEGDIRGLGGKLNNPGFTNKAPATWLSENADDWQRRRLSLRRSLSQFTS